MVDFVTRLLDRLHFRRNVQTLQSGASESPVLILEPNPKLSPVARNAETLEQLRVEGFPMIMVDMFRKTADKMDCVIMSRAPGKATPDLIENGHDLKGYQVKAKSCDWGPMSGFLCQVPCLNKKGSAKIDYNDGYYYKYFKYIKALQGKDLDFSETVKAGFSPFVPLRLFDLMKQKAIAVDNKSIVYKKIVGDDVYGISVHKKGGKATVYMEFLLRKSAPVGANAEVLWDVYHGRIFTFSPDDKKPKWKDFFDAKISYMDGVPGKEKISDKTSLGGGRKLRTLLGAMPSNLVDRARYTHIEDTPAAITTELAGVLQTEGAMDAGASAHPGFFSLCVAQNPYPPYAPQPQRIDKNGVKTESDTEYATYLAENEKHVHKNAVTGDYDLFAVWPKRNGVGWEELVRASDIQQKVEDVYKQKLSNLSRQTRKEGFFTPAIGKPFGLSLTGSPNVVIDIIPGFDEIEAWEDPEFGNAHNATLMAAQTLNSFVYNHFLTFEKTRRDPALANSGPNPRHFTYPHVAFHSDEGGRPGIDEIDFPVGVFLPKSLAMLEQVQKVLNKNYKEGDFFIRQFLLDKCDYDKFLALAVAVRNECFVSFNHVWMTYMFALVVKTPKDTGFFKPMADDRKTIGDVRLGNIRGLLSQLFIGGNLRISRPEGSSGHWGMEAVERWPKEAKAAASARN
jgi:hypothetical protein